MRSKGILIGTFVNKKKILTFLETLKNDFEISFDKVFVYEIDSNKNEYLATFKALDKSYLGKIGKSTVMHVKNGCLFSINALNKLISSEKGDNDIPNKEVVVDWEKYKNKLIILRNNQLNIKKISKIEDKCSFLME